MPELRRSVPEAEETPMKAEARYNAEGPWWEVIITEPGKPPVTFIGEDGAYPGEVAERLAAAYNTRAEQLGLV